MTTWHSRPVAYLTGTLCYTGLDFAIGVSDSATTCLLYYRLFGMYPLTRAANNRNIAVFALQQIGEHGCCALDLAGCAFDVQIADFCFRG